MFSHNLAVNPGEGGQIWWSVELLLISLYPIYSIWQRSAHPAIHPGGGAVLGASGDGLPVGYPGVDT